MTPNPNLQSILNRSRQDKWLLVLDLPPALRNITTHSARTKDLVNLSSIQYSIYGAPVPSINVPHVDLPFSGQTFKVSSHTRPTYPPLTVLFGVDNLFTNWWVLWKWLALLNDAQKGHYTPVDPILGKTKPIVGTLADYATGVSIYGMSEFNKRVIEFKYFGAFITSLSEIVYNYRTTEEIAATFTLEYNQFEAYLLD